MTNVYYPLDVSARYVIHQYASDTKLTAATAVNSAKCDVSACTLQKILGCFKPLVVASVSMNNAN